MSPIGRIFIVLNLVLAAVFLGWAANALATNQNWKDQHTELTALKETELQAKQDEIATLTTRLGQLEEEARTRREERDSLQTQLEAANSRIAEAQRENETMQASLTKISQTLSDYDDTISQLNSEKDRAVERAMEMERERNDAVASATAAEQARRDAEGLKNESETRIADLQAERTTLQDELSRLETRLQTLVNVTGVPYEDILAQPQINAAVLEVRHDLPPGLVMLNVGANADVKRGYTFEIFSGNQYKGQVRVENVQDNVSSALIIRSVPGTQIAQGDRAATHL